MDKDEGRWEGDGELALAEAINGVAAGEGPAVVGVGDGTNAFGVFSC